jgi:hypothetical protein
VKPKADMETVPSYAAGAARAPNTKAAPRPSSSSHSVENTSTECSSAVAHLLRYAHRLGNSNTVLRDTYSVLSRVGRRAACSARAERPTCFIGVTSRSRRYTQVEVRDRVEETRHDRQLGRVDEGSQGGRLLGDGSPYWLRGADRSVVVSMTASRSRASCPIVLLTAQPRRERPSPRRS